MGTLTGRLGFEPPMNCVDEFRVLCHRDQCCTELHRHQLHINLFVPSLQPRKARHGAAMDQFWIGRIADGALGGFVLELTPDPLKVHCATWIIGDYFLDAANLSSDEDMGGRIEIKRQHNRTRLGHDSLTSNTIRLVCAIGKQCQRCDR